MKLSKALTVLGSISFFLCFLWPIATFAIGTLSGSLSTEWIALTVFPAVLFVIAAVIFFAGSTAASALHNRSILAHGIPSQAKILKLTETGTTINDNPVVRFVLEVRPADRPAFRAETDKLISLLDIPRIQPGTVVPVKYDPKSKAVALALPAD